MGGARHSALLWAALALCCVGGPDGLRGAAAVVGQARPPPLPLDPPMTYADARAVIAANVALRWANSTGLHCASTRILRGSPESVIGPEARGDGFMRIQSTATADIAAILALSDNQAHTLDYTRITEILAGANLWMYNMLNASLPDNTPVMYDIVHVPDAVWNNGHVTKINLNSYLLDAMGYDCILGATMESPDAMLFSNSLHIHQAFGFVVVAPLPQPQPVPLVNSLFLWIRPFSGGVWGITVLEFFISALLMAWFEQDAFEEEIGLAARNKMRLLVHGLYISFSTFTTQNAEGFKASTLPGRIYRTVFAFCTLLTISTYVANLAAVLVTPPVPTALINNINDFASNGVPACVLNASDHITFMQSQYPNTKLTIVDSIYTSDLLRAVLDPTVPCAGAVAPDVSLYYIMGQEGDPTAEFCSLSITGQPLNQGYYGLTFSSSFPLDQIASLSGLVSTSIVDGSYNEAMKELGNFPQARPNCAGYVVAAADKDGDGSMAFEADALNVRDFAGIFILLGVGMAVSILIKLLLMNSRQGVTAAKHCAAQLCYNGVKPPPQGSPTARNSGEVSAEQDLSSSLAAVLAAHHAANERLETQLQALIVAAETAELLARDEEGGRGSRASALTRVGADVGHAA